MSQETITPIQAKKEEILKEFEKLLDKAFPKGLEMLMLDMDSRPMRRRFENLFLFSLSTIIATTREECERCVPEEKNGCICGLGTDGNDECLSQCSGGFNSCRSLIINKLKEII